MPASQNQNSWKDSPKASPCLDPEAKWNVFIAYDDVHAGQHAMRTIKNVERRLDWPETWHPSLWRFDLLEDPDGRVLATADALQADLIVISASSRRDLPASLQDWINACLTQKRGTAAAVVAMLGPEDNPDEPDSPRIQFIKSAAKEAGLDFFMRAGIP